MNTLLLADAGAACVARRERGAYVARRNRRTPARQNSKSLYGARSVAGVIPEIPLVPAPETPEAKQAVGFKWAGEVVGHRHKLGGEPDWLQDAEIPACASCGEAMTFYGQLDSIGDEHCLADVGMIYVFVCFGCFTARSLLQSG